MNVDSTSGAVGIVCNPVYEVSLTVTGGTMPFVDLLDETTNSHDNLTDISSASRLIPPGHNVQVQMLSVTAKAANASIKLTGAGPFVSATSYVCFGSDVTPKHTGALVTFTYTSGSQFQYALSGSRSAASDTVDIVCEGH